MTDETTGAASAAPDLVVDPPREVPEEIVVEVVTTPAPIGSKGHFVVSHTATEDLDDFGQLQHIG